MVEPLRAKTMTLHQLQMRTLDLIRKLRFQLRRQAHEEGMSDAEFLENNVDNLEQEIYADRAVAKMHRKQQKAEAE